MPTIDDLRKELQDEVDQLEERFLRNWIPAKPEDVPDDYQHDVKAFCVLAHASFEEFAEELSFIAMKRARDAWLAKAFTPATVALLAAYRFSLVISEDEEGSQDRIFDQVRKGLDECVDSHSKALAKNHGFSLKYLRNMLTPVGIDVPESVKHLESLRELADARGSYAHTRSSLALYGEWKRAGRPMSPEKAQSTVRDCLDLCDLLVARLKAIL